MARRKKGQDGTPSGKRGARTNGNGANLGFEAQLFLAADTFRKSYSSAVYPGGARSRRSDVYDFPRSVLIAVFGLAAAVVLLGCAAMSPLSKPSSREVQVAVYEAVLQSWLGTDHSPALVDERLSAAPKSTDANILDCLKHLDTRSAADTSTALIEVARFFPTRR